MSIEPNKPPVTGTIHSLATRSQIEPQATASTQVEKPTSVEVKKPEIILTQVIDRASGNHHLILESPGHPTTISLDVQYEDIAHVTNPSDGTVYCGVTDKYKGKLPRVFVATPHPYNEQRK